MFAFKESEYQLDSYFDPDFKKSSAEFLGPRERKLLIKYLKKSLNSRLSVDYDSVVQISVNHCEVNSQPKEIQSTDIARNREKNYFIKPSNLPFKILLLVSILILFLQPSKAYSLNWNGMTSIYGSPQQQQNQQFYYQQPSIYGQQYPAQSQYYQFKQQNRNPTQSYLNQNNFAVQNNPSAYGSQISMSNPQAVSEQSATSLYDQLFRLISDNKKNTASKMEVKNSANSLFRSLGLVNGKINLEKLDSASSDYVEGYKNALDDVKKEVDQSLNQDRSINPIFNSLNGIRGLNQPYSLISSLLGASTSASQSNIPVPPDLSSILSNFVSNPSNSMSSQTISDIEKMKLKLNTIPSGYVMALVPKNQIFQVLNQPNILNERSFQNNKISEENREQKDSEENKIQESDDDENETEEKEPKKIHRHKSRRRSRRHHIHTKR